VLLSWRSSQQRWNHHGCCHKLWKCMYSKKSSSGFCHISLSYLQHQCHLLFPKETFLSYSVRFYFFRSILLPISIFLMLHIFNLMLFGLHMSIMVIVLKAAIFYIKEIVGVSKYQLMKIKIREWDLSIAGTIGS